MSKKKTPVTLPAAKLVRAVLRRGGPAVVARRLGVHVGIMHKWMRGQHAAPAEHVARVLRMAETGEVYCAKRGRPPSWKKRKNKA